MKKLITLLLIAFAAQAGLANNIAGGKDTITIEHKAINREGFALGAIIAAEKIINTKGFYEFRELLF